MTRTMPSECLLNNIIDKDLQAALIPLSIFQKIFIISKFRITNNFITPSDKKYYVKSFIGLSILISLNCYRFSLSKVALNYIHSISMMLIVWIDFFYFNITATIIYIVSASQSENTVLLIIKLQNAISSINFNRTELLSNIKVWNWINIICIVASYVILTLTTVARAPIPALIFLMFPFMIFDLNIIYASRTIAFINNGLEMWNTKMVYYENGNVYRCHERAEGHDFGESMLNAYKDLIKAFHLTGKVYQFAISYHMLDTFVCFLITVQSYIEYGKARDAPEITKIPVTIILSLLRCIKNVIILTMLCISTEKIYENVRIAETICARALVTGDSDLHRMCKKVMRFNRGTFRKLSALSMCVDAALPLRVLAAVVVYTVVLLQFAFL